MIVQNTSSITELQLSSPVLIAITVSSSFFPSQAKYKAGTEIAECVAYHQAECRHGRATRGSETSDQPYATISQQNPVYENISRHIQTKTIEIQHRM